jgi:hypothetical protein
MTITNQKHLTASQILDAYFLETRAKLLEIAANLDRVDRAAAGDKIADPRLVFIGDALKILQSDTPGRAQRILQRYSKD